MWRAFGICCRAPAELLPQGRFYVILAGMRLTIDTYISGDSPVHTCDACVKIALLAAYSATLFLVDTWAGLALCALAFGGVLVASGVPFRKVFLIAVPVYVIVAFMVACNSFVVGTSSTDGFGFSPTGFLRGCFFAVRVLLLVFASLMVSFTSTSTELVDALRSFLSPFGKLRVPVDDAAMVFSIALRFIPITAEEFERVRAAQWSRGAAFECGTLVQRLCAWRVVFVPLFVGLFRRADSLAKAMDARCYGAPGVRRTSLSARPFRPRSAAVLVVGAAFCVVCSVWF